MSKRGRKKKSQKNDKSVEVSEEILESVSEKLEMAGQAMDFFENDVEDEALDEDTADDIHENTDEAATAMDLVDPEVLLADGELEAQEIDEDGELIEENFVAPDELLAAEAEVSSTGDDLDAPVEETVEASLAASDIEADEQEELFENDSDSAAFVDDDQLISTMESLLFASDRPIGLGIFKTIFKDTNIRTKDIKRGLEQLQGSYADPSRGVTLEEVGSGYQLRTKVDNLPFLSKLGKSKPFKLSGPALEVLSIVAYKQPLVKSEVDHIRGVESGHLVRALMDRGLVNFQGKSELPGKPMQYGTTRKFLEIFGLRNLKELPSLDEIDQLLPDGIGAEGDDEKLSDVTDSMSEEIGAKYSEGEEELEKITEKLGDIDTSSEFFEVEKQRQKDKRELEKARDIQEAIDLGEDVETKDVRWLERYDQKKAEAELAAGTFEPEAEIDSEGDDGVALSDELQGLTEEAQGLEAASPIEASQDDESGSEIDTTDHSIAAQVEIEKFDQETDELDEVTSEEYSAADGTEVDPFQDMDM